VETRSGPTRSSLRNVGPDEIGTGERWHRREWGRGRVRPDDIDWHLPQMPRMSLSQVSMIRDARQAHGTFMRGARPKNHAKA